MNNLYRLPPQPAFNFGGLVIDNFACDGGASTGIELLFSSRPSYRCHMRFTLLNVMNGRHKVVKTTPLSFARAPLELVCNDRNPPYEMKPLPSQVSTRNMGEVYPHNKRQTLINFIDKPKIQLPIVGKRRRHKFTRINDTVTHKTRNRCNFLRLLKSFGFLMLLPFTFLGVRYPNRSTDRSHRTYRLDPAISVCRQPPVLHPVGNRPHQKPSTSASHNCPPNGKQAPLYHALFEIHHLWLHANYWQTSLHASASHVHGGAL